MLRHCSLGTHRVGLLQASGPNIFISQSIRNFVFCVFLFEDALFNTDF